MSLLKLAATLCFSATIAIAIYAGTPLAQPTQGSNPRIRITGSVTSSDLRARTLTIRTSSGPTFTVRVAGDISNWKPGAAVTFEAEAPHSDANAVSQPTDEPITALKIERADPNDCRCPDGFSGPLGCTASCIGNCDRIAPGYTCKILFGHPYRGTCGCERP